MAKGKRNRHRRPTIKQRQAEQAKRQDAERAAVTERAATAAVSMKMAKEEKAANPYFWEGDNLMHRDGHRVGTVADFPSLQRAREVNRRGQKAIAA